MAKNHGARQQKKVEKQKAKRSEKRSKLFRRDSDDPTVRLQRAEKWPVVQALVATDLWNDGIGYLVIARQEAEGRLVFAVFLVDVYCLGVKNAFWKADTPSDFNELIRKLEKSQSMSPISPAGLVKIIQGAVEYAQSFGFRPHPDYRHSSTLLAGIDPGTCPQEFRFGRDGKPYYIQGPNESFAQALAISKRVRDAGGHYIAELPVSDCEEFADVSVEYDPLD